MLQHRTHLVLYEEKKLCSSVAVRCTMYDVGAVDMSAAF